jgi:hypothetical protein
MSALTDGTCNTAVAIAISELSRGWSVEEGCGFDQEGMARDELGAGDIYVDAEGDWFYQGNKIIREDILAFFYDHLEYTADGIFAIVWKDQRCVLKVDDTPWVITRVDRGTSEEEGGEQVRLMLKHLSAPEFLDATTLWVGKDNVLHARVRSGRFPARFSRPAYYQIGEWIQEDPVSGEFLLEIGDERYPIQSCE